MMDDTATELEKRLAAHYERRTAPVRGPDALWEAVSSMVARQAAAGQAVGGLAGPTQTAVAGSAAGPAAARRRVSLQAILIIAAAVVLALALLGAALGLGTPKSNPSAAPATGTATGEPGPTATSAIGAGEQPVYSEDFEAATLSWAGPSNPDYSGGTDTLQAHDGKASAFLQSTATDLAADSFGYLYHSTSASALVGKRLRYSAYVKADEVDVGAGLWMRVDADGPDGHWPLNFDNMSDRPIKGTSDWKRYEIVMDVPSKSVSVYAGVLIGGKGKVWIDDAQIEEVSADIGTTGVSTHDQLCNTSFEDPQLCWGILSTDPDNCTATTDAIVGYGGSTISGRAQFAAGAADGAWCGFQQRLYAEQFRGKRVRASVYIKTDQVTEEATLALVGTAANSSVPAIDLTSQGVRGTTDWQEREVVADVPDGTVSLTFAVMLKGPGKAWFDDAQIEVVGNDVPLTGSSTPAQP